MLIAWWPSRSNATTFRRWACSVSALACGAAFLISFRVISGPTAIELREGWQWLGPMAAAATVLGMLAGALASSKCRSSNGHVTIGFFEISTLFGAALAIITAVLLHPPGSIAHPMYWKLMLGGLVFASWLNLEWLAQRRPGPSLPLTLWLIFGGLSMVILYSPSANFSLMAASLSAAMGASFIIALLNPRLNLSHGAMHVLATLLAGLLVVGLIYNQVAPIVSFGLIALAPAMLWIGEAPAVTRLRPWQAVMTRVALAAIPVFIAVLLAMHASAAN